MFLIIIISIFVFAFILAILSNKNNDSTSLTNMNEIDKDLQDKNFKATKHIPYDLVTNRGEIQIDENNKKVAICHFLPQKDYIIIDFKDLIECTVIEDSSTIMKGGVGRAIAGGVIAGGVGAVVGSNTRKSQNVVSSLQLRIVTKNINSPLILINTISSTTDKNSLLYKYAMQFINNAYATLISIIDLNKNIDTPVTENNNSNDDIVNQLEKLSKLKNANEISQDEYEDLKKKLLNKI